MLQRISKADDYITWTVTLLPFITGMAVAVIAELLQREQPALLGIRQPIERDVIGAV